MKFARRRRAEIRFSGTQNAAIGKNRARMRQADGKDLSGGRLYALLRFFVKNAPNGTLERNKAEIKMHLNNDFSLKRCILNFGSELSPLYELRKSDIGAASLDLFSVSFTDSIELLCFLSESEK